MATHFSILAWKIPWTDEPVGLQSTGPQRWLAQPTPWGAELANPQNCKIINCCCFQFCWDCYSAIDTAYLCLYEALLSTWGSHTYHWRHRNRAGGRVLAALKRLYWNLQDCEGIVMGAWGKGTQLLYWQKNSVFPVITEKTENIVHGLVALAEETSRQNAERTNWFISAEGWRQDETEKELFCIPLESRGNASYLKLGRLENETVSRF